MRLLKSILLFFLPMIFSYSAFSEITLQERDQSSQDIADFEDVSDLFANVLNDLPAFQTSGGGRSSGGGYGGGGRGPGRRPQGGRGPGGFGGEPNMLPPTSGVSPTNYPWGGQWGNPRDQPPSSEDDYLDDLQKRRGALGGMLPPSKKITKDQKQGVINKLWSIINSLLMGESAPSSDLEFFLEEISSLDEK